MHPFGVGLLIALALGGRVGRVVGRVVPQRAAQFVRVPTDGLRDGLPRLPAGASFGHAREDVFVDGRGRFGWRIVVHGAPGDVWGRRDGAFAYIILMTTNLDEVKRR